MIVDAHQHVFDPRRFPYRPDAAYLPPPHESGTPADLAAVHAAHGVTHALLVNPSSGYGDDNRCMLDAIRRAGGRWRAIARLMPDTGAATLARLARRGVVGVRFDLAGDGLALWTGEAARAFLGRLARADLIVQVQCEHDQLAEAALLFADAGVRLVVDHMGRPDVARGIRQPGFRALLDLAATGRCWVKLSGWFRLSARPWPHADLDPYVRALLRAFGPDRLMWGSDWPFLRPGRRVDYGPMLTVLDRHVAGAARRRILWTTPARLFGLA